MSSKNERTSVDAIVASPQPWSRQKRPLTALSRGGDIPWPHRFLLFLRSRLNLPFLFLCLDFWPTYSG